MVLFLFFFFFQAEDGIRVLYVTGVQTCALPILRRRSGGRLVMSVPARLICPACCGRSPAMVSSSIVFPAPDGPSTTSTRSGGIPRLTGPRVKDPARALSPLTDSPRSAVGTVNPG